MSNIDHHGPNYYQPTNIETTEKEKPKEFASFDSMIGSNKPSNEVNPIYPSVDPNSYKQGPNYQPTNNVPEEKPENINKSPTISQIMRDFK